MAMGRVKTGPNGLYYDPNDSGPDQGGSQEAEDFRAQNGMSSANTGINGGGGAAAATQPAENDPAASGTKPTPGMTREQWRDAWMSSGQKSAADTDAWLLANGATKVADNGTFRTPQGEILDLGIGYKSGGMVTPGWTRTDGGGNDGGSGSGSGSVRGAAGASRNSLMDYLMGRVNQSLAINRNDPMIRQQTDAFDAQGQKARRDFLGDFAEQNGAFNSGAMTGQARMTAETLGKSVGSFEATLMQKELEARRAEIQNALNGAIGMISEQERNDLTREMGKLENALAYARLNQDAYQFDINDEFRRSPLGTPN